MSASETNRKIHKALNSLMAAWGLNGESATETLFDVLSQSIFGVHEEWWIVEASHEKGFGCDVNSLLTDQIEAALAQYTEEEGSVQSCDDALFEMISQPRTLH
jgi:hypothetical protein